MAEAVGSEYLAVGLGGVWNWRTSDKEKRPDPDRPTSRTVRVNSRPIEDLGWIVWTNRTVYICFDSDGAQNEQVQAAEKALVAELRKRGARPLVVSLQPGLNGRKIGIDDWLAEQEPQKRDRALKRLLAAASPRRRTSCRPEQPLDLEWEPSGGFMRTFEEFADEQTDAPAIYRPFTALSILTA